ncbi:MAG: sulfurtransferase TusA family protein [Lachnospiraceae bacterium]|nr:sulfurtransferase TusA family protein [Lachnospiraceae bacterium]
MTRVDARGLSCPEPVILTMEALAGNEAAYEILVDNKTACENVSRYAEGQGYKAEAREDGEDIIVSLSK